MINAKDELLEHLEGKPKVKLIRIEYGYFAEQEWSGKLEDVLHHLCF